MQSSSNKPSGFTTIELLIVVPMVILIVGVIVGYMVSMTGSALVSRERLVLSHSLRSAMERIENDVRDANKIEPTIAGIASPQGLNNGTQSFASPASQLMLERYATTADPLNQDRQLVYMANSPNACSGNYQQNTIAVVYVIYFVKNNTLFRRTIFPPGQTTCGTIWQQNTCSLGVSGGNCQATDEMILTNVSEFSLTYKDSSSVVATPDKNTLSADVTLKTNGGIAGYSFSESSILMASRL